MAYSERLAERVREQLKTTPGLHERKMFGGLCFTVHGNMCCGVQGNDLMLRAGESTDRLLKRKHARPMDFTGRPLKGMLYVDGAGVRTTKALASWLEPALAFAQSLPKKGPQERRARSARRGQRPLRRRRNARRKLPSSRRQTSFSPALGLRQLGF